MRTKVISFFTHTYTKAAFLFLAGLGLGWVLRYYASVQTSLSRGAPIRQGESASGLINPLLGCEIGDQSAFTEFKTMRQNLNIKTTELLADQRIKDVSIYLRTLKSGRWIGVNENTLYAPASMLKVLIMISYYKEAEQKPSLLEQKIVSTEDTTHPQNETGNLGLQRGRAYTVEDLIEKMIKDSDNDAMDLLIGHANQEVIKNTFTILGLPLLSDNKLDDVSAKQYSLVFRTLYSASYLNDEYSEKALTLLTKTNFTQGIDDGVPPKVVVAHKFGVRQMNGIQELHDCGIVYYPQHPYFLCVMTKGTDLVTQARALEKISAAAYSEIDTYFKNSNEH